MRDESESASKNTLISDKRHGETLRTCLQKILKNLGERFSESVLNDIFPIKFILKKINHPKSSTKHRILIDNRTYRKNPITSGGYDALTNVQIKTTAKLRIGASGKINYNINDNIEYDRFN